MRYGKHSTGTLSRAHPHAGTRRRHMARTIHTRHMMRAPGRHRSRIRTSHNGLHTTHRRSRLQDSGQLPHTAKPPDRPYPAATSHTARSEDAPGRHGLHPHSTLDTQRISRPRLPHPHSTLHTQRMCLGSDLRQPHSTHDTQGIFSAPASHTPTPHLTRRGFSWLPAPTATFHT